MSLRATLLILFLGIPIFVCWGSPTTFKKALEKKGVLLPKGLSNTEKEIWHWHHMQVASSRYKVEELMAFIRKHPSWPRMGLLQQRVEEMLTADTPQQVINWFHEYPPRTGQGKRTLANALLKINRKKEAQDLIKKTWHTKHFSKAHLRAFYKKYKKYLERQDHQKRAETFFWLGNVKTLRALKPYLPQDYQHLTHAIIHLIQKAPGIDYHMRHVPAHLKSHPILQYYRLHWRLQKKKYNDAYTFFKECQKKGTLQQNPSAWVKARLILFRHLLKEKKYQAAYDVLTPHYLKAVPERVSLEWYAGWLSLVHLHNPGQALSHFQQFLKNVTTSISKAKGHYWLGVTFKQLGQTQEAEKHFQKSMAYPLTFYGQLAHEEMGVPFKVTLTIPHIDKRSLPAAWQSVCEVLQVTQKHQLSKIAKTFLIELAKQAETTREREQVILLAKHYAPEHTVLCAKIVGKKGSLPLKISYPMLEKPLLSQLGPPLNKAVLHALIRQESGFNPQGVSPAGAHGLMQLLPKTAKHIAKLTKQLPPSKDKLLSSPRLNVQLGSTYFSHLLHYFDGSLILALASYNAGQSRVLHWIKTYGDPRDNKVDILSWIESIPYEETRSYIYRILEAIPIYELLMIEESHPAL